MQWNRQALSHLTPLKSPSPPLESFVPEMATGLIYPLMGAAQVLGRSLLVESFSNLPLVWICHLKLPLSLLNQITLHTQTGACIIQEELAIQDEIL